MKKMMITNNLSYTAPAVEIVECVVERGFDVSGVEAPDFENENEI